MLTVRPRVQDLLFRLYDHAVPTAAEDAVATRTVRRPEYRFTVHLTAAGHVFEWTDAQTHLVEVITTHDGLPTTPELISHVFSNERRNRCRVGGVWYEVSWHAEILPPEVFLNVHDELSADGAKRGFFHLFSPHPRLSVVPLSWVTVEPLPSGLSIATFHTFPAECAVVKTQSLIEPCRG